MLDAILGVFSNGLNNWKTSLLGIIGAISVFIFNHYGVEIPKEVQVGTVAIVVFLFGFLAKDSNIHGTVKIGTNGPLGGE